MSKSDTINVRIEPELKENAERILSDLGISVSTAINIYYRQIVEKNGIPMELTIKPSPVFENLTTAELTEMLEKSHKEYLDGDYISADDAFMLLNDK